MLRAGEWVKFPPTGDIVWAIRRYGTSPSRCIVTVSPETATAAKNLGLSEPSITCPLVINVSIMLG